MQQLTATDKLKGAIFEIAVSFTCIAEWFAMVWAPVLYWS